MVRHITSVRHGEDVRNQIEIVKAQRSDIPAMVDVMTAAFSSSLLARVMSPNPDHEKSRRDMINEFEKVWDQPELWPLVARDTVAKEVVGIALWALFVEPDSKHETIESTSGVPSMLSWNSLLAMTPRGAGVQIVTESDPRQRLRNRITREAKGRSDSWTKGKQCYCLRLLAVDPETQGIGVGSRLLATGTDRADEDGRVCFLQATPVGYPLYLHRGFHDVGAIEIDLSEYFGQGLGYGIYRSPDMVRLPSIRDVQKRSGKYREGMQGVYI